MIWLKLGWRNLRRNPRRTAIEVLSVAGSIFIAVLFQNFATGSYAKMIEDGTQMASGHIGFYADGYLEDRQASLSFSVDELLADLESEPGVRDVYPRAYIPGLVQSSRQSRPTVILGIDFERERELNPMLLAQRFVDGGVPEADSRGTPEAVIGVTLAEELGLKVGKKFVVMAQGPDGEIQRRLMRVGGIVKTGVREIDAATVIAPRGGLGIFLGEGNRAHEVAVMLDDIKLIDETLPRLKQLTAGKPGVDAYHWEEAMPQLADMIRMDRAQIQIVVVILFALVGIGTINTLLMSVMERVREFGLLRALGVNRMGVRKMLFGEAFVLASAGIGLGLGVALLLNVYLSTKGIDFTALMEGQSVGGLMVDPVMRSGWDIPRMAVMTAGMFLIALLAALYPAQRALKVLPSEAMRRY